MELIRAIPRAKAAENIMPIAVSSLMPPRRAEHAHEERCKQAALHKCITQWGQQPLKHRKSTYSGGQQSSTTTKSSRNKALLPNAWRMASGRKTSCGVPKAI